jgi:hypothetical protein
MPARLAYARRAREIGRNGCRLVGQCALTYAEAEIVVPPPIEPLLAVLWGLSGYLALRRFSSGRRLDPPA